MNHSFNVEVATLYGVDEAILLENIYFWCNKNKANGTNYHDGYYWTYNSVKAFLELFPYMTKARLSSALQHLESEGLIKSGVYNPNKYDRTKWYTTTNLALAYFDKSISENRKWKNQKAEMNITDINTDINTYNNSANARPEQNVDNSVDIVDNSRQCENKSDCQKLKEIYVNNYSELYQQHVVTTPNPIINWAIAMKNLNAAIKSYGYDIIEKALKNSVHDDFVIKNGYSLITILSSGVLSGLVNGGRVINGNRSLASQMDFDVVHDDDIRF